MVARCWQRLRELAVRPFARWTGTVVLVVVLLVVGWWATHRTVAPVALTSATEDSGDVAGAAPTWTVPDWAPTEPDVTWQEMARVDLPVSKEAGPHHLTASRAWGFTQDDAGAALAAAHLLVRTFAGAGSAAFGPTIREQVTGTARQQLATRTRRAYEQAAQEMGVQNGDPLPLNQGWIVAYRFVSSGTTSSATVASGSAQSRTVQVLVEGSGEYLGFTEYTVGLVWVAGDWRMVAPERGDWSAVARSVQNPYPSSYRDYDTITEGEGA